MKNKLDSGKFTGIDDVKAIYGLIKALDPGSVVRESEVGLILGADSLLSRTFNFPNKITKGDLASAQFRNKLVTAVGSLYQTRKREFEDQIAPVVEEARVGGIDYNRVLYPSLRLSNKVSLFDQDKKEEPTAPSNLPKGLQEELALRKKNKGN